MQMRIEAGKESLLRSPFMWVKAFFKYFMQMRKASGICSSAQRSSMEKQSILSTTILQILHKLINFFTSHINHKLTFAINGNPRNTTQTAHASRYTISTTVQMNLQQKLHGFSRKNTLLSCSSVSWFCYKHFALVAFYSQIWGVVLG